MILSCSLQYVKSNKMDKNGVNIGKMEVWMDKNGVLQSCTMIENKYRIMK